MDKSVWAGRCLDEKVRSGEYGWVGVWMTGCVCGCVWISGCVRVCVWRGKCVDDRVWGLMREEVDVCGFGGRVLSGSVILGTTQLAGGRV